MGVEGILTGQEKDLGGGFRVLRLLPDARRQAVGPFVFFDHFGPFTVEPGSSHDVRPHPHIGLATVSYLFEGAIMHRDSLGSVQRIEPGAINWMTAGRGIVHSERGPDELKSQPYVNHGIQLWAALPIAHEEVAPEFEHTPAAEIPELMLGENRVRVLIGQAFGQRSPVKTYSPTIYLDVQLVAGEPFELPALAEQLALYPVDGEILVDGQPVSARTLVLLTPAATVTVLAQAAVRMLVLGGAALEGRRFIWWNFVSSRKPRILQAMQDWEQQAMGEVAGDAEFIPLPERRLIAD